MSENDRFYMPVVRIGSVYRVATASESMSGDPVPVSDLSSYLAKSHRKQLSTVHVFGRSADVDVYVPLDENDVAYVLVDSNFLPAEPLQAELSTQPERETHAKEILARYLESLTASCHVTDGLFVPTRLHLPNAFIWPRLLRRQIDMFGLPAHGRLELSRECSVEDIAAEPRAVILGAPGSGKTTLLRTLAMRLAERCRESASTGDECTVPVYLQLRHHDFRHEISMGESIAAIRATIASRFRSRIAWVLDGLDEVPAAQLASAKSAIKKLASENQHDAIFLCSRTSSYDGFLRSECAHYELQPFSWSQISQWVHQYIREYEPARTNELLCHLANVPELHSIASNPLLLSILTHQFQFEGVIPQQRVQLLERFVATLCVDWDSSRGISRMKPDGILPHRRLILLAWLAFEMKLRGVTSIRPAEFDAWLCEAPAMRPNQDASAILQELADDTGLLISTESGTAWAFSHVVLQDYLVARHLVAKTEDVSSLLQKTIQGDSWYDVWIFACSVTNDPRPLIRGILRADLAKETKAVLIAGAVAQGLEFDHEILAESQQLLGDVFQDHAVRYASSLRLVQTESGLRATLGSAIAQGVGDYNGLLPHNDFVKNLVALLYRARWWHTGQSVMADITKRAGVLGQLCNSVFHQDGVLAAPSDDSAERGGDAIVIEINSSPSHEDHTG